MTFWMVLNSFEWGIKHAICLTMPCFLIEDAPSIVVTLVLPVATNSNVLYILSSSNQFCSFSGDAFTEPHQENPFVSALSP